jgi:hypothetical protein
MSSYFSSAVSSPSLPTAGLVKAQKLAVTSGPAGGLKSRGRKRKHGEMSKVFNAGQSMPGMSKHISGLQTIKVQSTLQSSAWVTSSSSVPTYVGQYFTFGQFGNASAMEGVFDQYRIDEIEAWIIPSVTYNNNVAADFGRYSTCVDYDDANTPAALTTVPDHQDSLTSSCIAAHYHKWKPQFAIAAFSGAFSSYGTSAGFLDMGSPNVQHFGLKFSATAGTAAVTFDLVYRLTCTLRSVGIA